MNGFKLVLRLFIILIFLSTGKIAMSEMGGEGKVLPSLDWQKMELEEKISEKIKRGLDAIITSKQYIIDVDIVVTEPTKPDFTHTPPPPPKNVRFSNASSESAPKDYIVFSQLGLEAPLISEFEESENKKSEYEYLWKYNENLDIFKNIEEVNIKVSLSEKLLDETKNSIKKIVENLKFGISEITPTINIEYIDLEEKIDGGKKKSTGESPLSFREKLDLMTRFGNALGLILAVILLGMIAYFLFKMYEKIQQGHKETAPPQMQPPLPREEDKKEDLPEEAKGGGAGEVTEDDETDLFSGVERFKQFWQKSERDALILVKKWIVEDTEMSRKALSALVQQMENPDLIKLFQSLGAVERDNWRSVIEQEGKIKDLKEVNNFISRQIIEDMIVPPAVQDLETVDLLMTLEETSAALLIKDHPSEGAMLLNIMNTKYVGKILEYLTADEINQVMEYSFAVNKDIIKKNIVQFKEILRKYSAKKVDREFVSKVFQLIPLANVETETVLYRNLALQCDREQLEHFARKYYPAEIIKVKFEDDIKENLLKSYPMNKKTELIASITDEEEKLDLLDSFAPSGSTAREMIEFELEKYEDDPALQKSIFERRDEIWREYIDHCRKVIKSDASFKQESEIYLEEWINEVSVLEEIRQAA
ncbi:MAG: hypothetical protein H6622_04070 [Halobacteriovoraceae bacterium]|nr:hypothetical protein [Halobacteriovoraceae bacterium]